MTTRTKKPVIYHPALLGTTRGLLTGDAVVLTYSVARERCRRGPPQGTAGGSSSQQPATHRPAASQEPAALLRQSAGRAPQSSEPGTAAARLQLGVAAAGWARGAAH